MPSAYTALLLDLDGTVVDSLPGIQYSVEQAVASHTPGRPVPDLRPYIGPPVREVMRLAMGEEDGVVLDQWALAFRQTYDSVGWMRGAIYGGMGEFLKRCREACVRLFIVTNKPILPTMSILRHLRLDGWMELVGTPDLRSPPYPHKSDVLQYVVQTSGLDVRSALFVGDSHDDGIAAQNHGVAFCAAAYGYGSAWKDVALKKIGIVENASDLHHVLFPGPTTPC